MTEPFSLTLEYELLMIYYRFSISKEKLCMFKNGLTWQVRDNGIAFSDIKDWEQEISGLTTELSETEKQSDFARYYLRQLKMPTHENLKASEYDNPLPKECMFMPEDFVRRMDSDEINHMKSGYGVMDNGIGFSMSHILWSGVTDEKLQYFIDNFIPEEDLFYKCWYPGLHMRHYTDACVEDVGLGMELIHFLSRLGPSEYAGSSDYEYKDPNLCAVYGGGGVSWPLHDLFNPPRYCMQGNWLRNLPDGSGKEIFIIFWHGISWENGRFTRMIPEEEAISADRVRAHMNHSIWEYTQAAELINLFN